MGKENGATLGITGIDCDDLLRHVQEEFEKEAAISVAFSGNKRKLFENSLKLADDADCWIIPDHKGETIKFPHTLKGVETLARSLKYYVKDIKDEDWKVVALEMIKCIKYTLRLFVMFKERENGSGLSHMNDQMADLFKGLSYVIKLGGGNWGVDTLSKIDLAKKMKGGEI